MRVLEFDLNPRMPPFLARQASTKGAGEPKKIRALQKELNRKDKALAEVTAILTLKKRMQELWGDEDDDTDSRNES